MNAPLLHRPRLSVTLDGSQLSPQLVASLTEITLLQCLGTPAALDLTFSDPDGEALAVLKPGAKLELSGAGSSLMFSGLISELALDCDSGRRSLLRITAHDALQSLAVGQSLLALQDVSLEDLAARLAGDIGLSARCLEPVPRRKLLLQHEQTDLDLLCDFAADSGLFPVVRQGEMLLVSLTGDGEDESALTFGEGLLSLHARLSSSDWLPDGRLFSRDPVTLASRETKLSLARLDRVEMRDPGGTSDNKTRQVLNRLTASDKEAEALLQASLDRAAARVLVAEGLTDGDPALVPGRVVGLKNVAAPFQGSYVLTRTLHRFTATEGYVTEFSTEPPRRPAQTRHPLTAIGQVTGTDDPDKLGRCEVQLPDFGGLNAGWMQVVIAGAGARKGVTALPDTGDDVLILMPDGDPSRGVILGGVYGTKRLPKGAEDAPRGIHLRSKDGQVIDLKGSGGVLHLANRSGSLIDLMPGKMRLAAASDLIIEAPGKTITIRANEIKFERG